MPQIQYLKTLQDGTTELEVSGNVQVEWHPQIYGIKPYNDQPRDVLTVSLSHVRAAGGFEVEFDAERNGWVIYRTVCTGWDEAGAMIEKRKEVAFLDAFDSEEADPNAE